MAINEVTVTGRKFRKLVDETAKLWQRISFWTKASDVEFEDGKNAETKLGMINGITSDINGDSDNIAASIKVVNELNNKLGGFEPVLDAAGKITGYKTNVGGADTVFPFRSITESSFSLLSQKYISAATPETCDVSATIENDGYLIGLVSKGSNSVSTSIACTINGSAINASYSVNPNLFCIYTCKVTKGDKVILRCSTSSTLPVGYGLHSTLMEIVPR